MPEDMVEESPQSTMSGSGQDRKLKVGNTTVTFPLLTVIDDSGNVVAGCTIYVASVTDKSGVPISNHGLVLNTGNDPFITADYDAETHGEAILKLSISKNGVAITNVNASPYFFLSRDSGRIDAQVSSRSTYSGGTVLSVTNPVTVGTNNDKVGYSLSSAGLDQVAIEQGVNARQALCGVFAASCGLVAGAGTSQITISGGNVATTRISAKCDWVGNRTQVTLTLPQ